MTDSYAKSMRNSILAICLLAIPLLAGSKELNACGIKIPEIPGFQLDVSSEGNVCYGSLASNSNLNPDILTEENRLLIEPVSFGKSLNISGRFDNQGLYLYDYSVDDVILQKSRQGAVDFPHSSASGSASVRVILSPYKLWDSEKDRLEANQRFSVNKTGLWFDCFYGLFGVRDSTVKLSACVPRSSVKTDAGISAIRDAFEWMQANNR